MSGDRHDALVIGAGPAGATAALMLARAGWSVAIVERSAFPRRKVCGEFISASNLPLLFALGVGELFQGLAGPPVRRVGLFAGAHEIHAPMPAFRGGPDPWGRALGREHLDLLLLEAARSAGARVWQPYTAAALEPEAGGWLCRLAGKTGGRHVRSRIVLAAHGSWARGPLLGLPRPSPRASELLGFKAHLLDCDLPPDLMPLLVFSGGYGGMVRSDDGRVSLSCCVRRDALEACRRISAESAGDALFRHILACCAPMREITRRAHLAGPWLAAGPIRPGIRSFFTGGVFQIGNRAGEAHPIVAEGIGMAIQSAWLLCRELIAAPDGLGNSDGLASIARAQNRRWRAGFGLRVHLAEALAQLALRPGAAGLLVSPARMVPALLTWGAALSGKAAQPVAVLV